jgi:hypothetical protein
MLKLLTDSLELKKEMRSLDSISLLTLAKALGLPHRLQTRSYLQNTVILCTHAEEDKKTIKDFLDKKKSDSVITKEVLLNSFFQTFLTPITNVPKHISVYGKVMYKQNIKYEKNVFYNIKITRVEGDYTVVKPGERVFAGPKHITL